MPNPRKDLKRKWALEREIVTLKQALRGLRAQRDGELGIPTVMPPAPVLPPEKDSPEELSDNLERALALPAAQTPLFKILHIDLIGKSIEEDLIQTENPDLRMDARNCGAKILAALIKAQKQMPGSVVNVQINTGDVEMGSSSPPPSRDQHRPPPAPKIQP